MALWTWGFSLAVLVLHRWAVAAVFYVVSLVSQYESKKRISAEEAMKHAYFRSLGTRIHSLPESKCTALSLRSAGPRVEWRGILLPPLLGISTTPCPFQNQELLREMHWIEETGRAEMKCLAPCQVPGAVVDCTPPAWEAVVLAPLRGRVAEGNDMIPRTMPLPGTEGGIYLEEPVWPPQGAGNSADTSAGLPKPPNNTQLWLEATSFLMVIFCYSEALFCTGSCK